MGRSPGKGAYSVAARAGTREHIRGSRASFVLQRTGFAPLLPASLLLVVLTSVIVTTALASFGSRALPAAAHKRLAISTATTIQISGQIGAAKARGDQRVIRAEARAALGPIPFTLLAGRWSDSFTLPGPATGNLTSLIQAADLESVRPQVVLTAGTWPGPSPPGTSPSGRQPIGVVLPATTAHLLGLSVGHVLALHDSLSGAPVRLLVTGLFRPRDPAAPFWRLSLLGISGKVTTGSFVTYGPMLVNPAAFGPGGLTVGEASWLIGVNGSRIPTGELAALSQRLSGAVATWQGTQRVSGLQVNTDQRLGGLQVNTGLPQALSALASSLVVARSLLLIGSLQLLLLAAAAAALAARLLASQRASETALLSARGAARVQLVLASLAEAALVVVAGAAAGLAGGSYLADRLMSGSGLAAARTGGFSGIMRAGVAGGAWWPAAAIMVLVVAVIMWPALRPVTPGAVRLRRNRLAGAARAGLDVVLIGLGALALWELRRYSASPRLAGGVLGIDPVLSVAPALALAGIALLPLRALPVAARLLDRLSARGRRLAATLASWQVSRQAVREGTPVLLVVLAVATGTLVLAQHQSWRQSQLDQAAFATGADVRVSMAAPLPIGRGGEFSRAPGVRAALPVSTTNSGFEIFALDARQAPGVVLLRPDLSAVPAATLWQRITLRHPAPGLILPGRPVRLGLRALLTPPPGVRLGPLSVSLSVQDGWGAAYSIAAGSLPADGRYHQLIATLGTAAQARYPLRLLGLTLSYQMPERLQFAAAQASLAIVDLAVSARASGGLQVPFARPGQLVRMSAAAVAPDLAYVEATGTRPMITAWRPSGGAARLAFTVGAGYLRERHGVSALPILGQLRLSVGAPPLPVPAIATRAFLASAGAHVGGVVLVPVGGASIKVRLVAAIAAFPTAGGGGPAVILDQAWLQDALAAQSQPPLPVTQWWLAAPHGVRGRLAAGSTVVTRTGSAAGQLDDPLPNVPQLALMVIVAAAGLLAGLGFVVSVVAAVRERRLQDALLAALGVGRGARAGQLCLEQLMLSVPGAAIGAAIGVVLAYLLVPPVTLTTGAAAPFPPAHVVIPLGWIGLLALGIAAVPVLAAGVAAAYWPDPAAGLRAGEMA